MSTSKAPQDHKGASVENGPSNYRRGRHGENQRTPGRSYHPLQASRPEARFKGGIVGLSKLSKHDLLFRWGKRKRLRCIPSSAFAIGTADAAVAAAAKAAAQQQLHPTSYGHHRPLSIDDASVEPTVMPLGLLREITNGFSEERKLGNGTYGSVYEGVYQDGVKVAVKLLYDMPGLDDEQFRNEFKNLTRLRHQNIVRLVGYCHNIQESHVEYKGKLVLAEKTYRALCLEYMSNGSLDKYLSDKCDQYNWPTGYRIIKGICDGLRYLHMELKPPIYHLDLKPANILLDKNMSPRIADFGISRLLGDEQTGATASSLGTIGYLPPEYIRSGLISNKFDIFSLGVIIIKIMAGRSGYYISAEMPHQEFINMVHQHWRNRQDIPLMARKAYSEQVKICTEIGLRCVHEDRHKRPTIEDITDALNVSETRSCVRQARY